jgi:2-octaprenyl-6-methoxyphenol hydroxylase
MKPSIRLLTTLGLWPGTLQAKTSPLCKLRLVDDTGSSISAPELVFDAAEIGEDAFGWNIPLALLLPALAARARDLGVIFVEEAATTAVSSATAVRLELSGGETLQAGAVLAADGRNSLLREAAGIRADQWSYDQVAIATSFAHSSPHHEISSEYHRPAGPFTTVPMPKGRSALVWMERPARAAELMGLDDRHFAAEVQVATHGELGLISEPGPRRAFEMRGLAAREFARNRIFLVGEAAHVVPPIGAQGLNMSLRDAAWAAELIAGSGDPGSAEVMADYDRMRRSDILTRQQIIGLMNRSLLSGLLVMEGARAAGLALLGRIGPLRRLAMRQGLGPMGELPRAMRA